jgi:hypothetical protein
LVHCCGLAATHCTHLHKSQQRARTTGDSNTVRGTPNNKNQLCRPCTVMHFSHKLAKAYAFPP